MSARIKVKESKACKLPWCEKPMVCNGLCMPHYQWERYHALNYHNMSYMVDYQEKHLELAKRARTFTPKRTQLRKVK
jgi:hypothetical protein